MSEDKGLDWSLEHRKQGAGKAVWNKESADKDQKGMGRNQKQR